MKINPVLERGVFLRRYKRFLADVELANGEVLTVHCANTGSMKNCMVPGTHCWYSRSDNPKRKLPGTLEIVTTPAGAMAGINTARPNVLVREGIENGVISELQGYATIRPEVQYGTENSRIDLLLEREAEKCFVEVKNVTLGMPQGLGLFPDAITTRGAKHLRELVAMVAAGHRGVLVFCVQHSGIERVAPADEIDPEYGTMLRTAMANGVEVLAYKCRMAPGEIAIEQKIDVDCSDRPVAN